MEKIIIAMEFATHAHTGQKRKGKETSYISHPLSVGLLLASSGAQEEVIIAGILHDTIEDTDVTYEDLVKEFGKDIADTVNDVTEQDKSLPWEERKQAALDHVKDMKPEAVLVKTADVLHNMSDQLADFKIEGESMFIKFNAGKEKQLERYEKLVTAIKETHIYNPLFPELEKTLKELQALWV